MSSFKLVKVEPLSPEWFAYRARRVTGTTAAGILGVANPKWSSPLSEWARLTGKVHPSTKIEDWHLWGQFNEPANRAYYQHVTRRLVDPVKGIAQHPSIDWIAYSPDGVVTVAEAGTRLILPALWEGKAPAPWKSDAWDKAIPLEYQVQTQLGMEVLGFGWSCFSAYIWPKPRIFDVPRDQRFIDAMLEKLTRFMEHNVKRDIPPEARAGERDREVLAELAGESPRAWDWTEEVAIKFDEQERLAASIGGLEEQREALTNRLVQLTRTRGWKQAKAEILAARRAATV